MLDFEKHKQAGENYLSCDVEKNLCFPMHCNETYEFLYCNDGLANVTVLDRIYRLRAGKCMVIPPKFAHAYETPDYSNVFICKFSKDWVPDFYEKHDGYVATFPVFSIEFAESLTRKMPFVTNTFKLKAVLYHILAEFETHTAFIPVDKKKVDVLNAIAKYVSHNFTEDISLKDLSDKMGYSYNYLSAVFNEYFGANFSDVVNIYRINYATDLLYSTTLSVAEISKKAGYDSVRSFNRNFQKYKGKSPRDVPRVRERRYYRRRLTVFAVFTVYFFGRLYSIKTSFV
ncbi:MAG: AraC family transcriptional regulator [Clostridiales bacterium]|nr:MAG: AraC family transcriptional regulator [Clostridiales bacterium]